MSKENYFNGGCSTCMFAERDERGRYIGHCSGFSNCSYEEYKGKTDITEEEKDRKIADLEAKLAESEKALEAKESVNQMYKATLNLKDSDFSDLVRENAQLKQQLAEQKRVCDWLDNVLKEYAKQEELLSKKLKSLGVDCIEDFGKTHNQDKISFAVEQLEKVKDWCQLNAIQCFYNEAQTEIKEKHIIIDRPQENGNPSLIKYIDNQIASLKKGVE